MKEYCRQKLMLLITKAYWSSSSDEITGQKKAMNEFETVEEK